MKWTCLWFLMCNWAAAAALPNWINQTLLPSSAGSDSSFAPVFSPDGGHLVFVSLARNLVSNQPPSFFFNIYARDIARCQTTLISVKAGASQPGTGHATSATCSSNADQVAFESDASDLVENDGNGASDVFLRDQVRRTTELVSINGTGTGAGNGASFTPFLSPDGRLVVFGSAASDLVAEDTNGVADLFVRDFPSRTTRGISLAAFAAGLALGPSHSPSFAGAAGRVAFVKSAANPNPDAAGLAEVYVHDLHTQETIWASSNLQTRLGARQCCYDPVLSADGNRVCFWASNSITGRSSLCDFDLLRRSNSVLRTSIVPSTPPSISADGRFIAYEDGANVYTIDRSTNSLHNLVNVDSTGNFRSDARAGWPSISRDGRSVTFISQSSNIDPSASNGVWQLFYRDFAENVSHLVSVRFDGTPAPRHMELSRVVFSPTGRQLAFDSQSALVEDDQNQVRDVYLRDLDGSSTILVSSSVNDTTARSTGGRSSIIPSGVSSNGTVVAFTSHYHADELGSGRLTQAGWVWDVDMRTNRLLSAETFEEDRDACLSADGRYIAYVRLLPLVSRSAIVHLDRVTQTIHTVPVVMNSGFGGAFIPRFALSPDGLRVAFELHDATGLYLRELSSDIGTNQLISVGVDGTAANDGYSFGPMFSPDGRWLAFNSFSLNLTTERKPGLFLRDLQNEVTRWLSLGTLASRYTFFPFRDFMSRICFSADSRFLAFGSPTGVIVHDLLEATNWVAAANGLNPSLSRDGRYVAFEDTRDATAPIVNIMLRDRATGQTMVVSRSRTGSPGRGHSRWPALSGDARFVVFVSDANDLVEHDTNGTADVFVRDLKLGTTMLVSAVGERAADGWSTQPILAADGRTVVFQSTATDLVPAGGYNSGMGLFRFRLGGLDSDGDGLDDDWEMAYFSTLARDGTGDWDGDGQPDQQEFLTGTDPTNQNSVFRVLTLQSLQGRTRVVWSAQPGRSYRVEFKADAAAPWVQIMGEVIPSTAFGSTDDVSHVGNEHGFYRVVLVR